MMGLNLKTNLNADISSNKMSRVERNTDIITRRVFSYDAYTITIKDKTIKKSKKLPVPVNYYAKQDVCV